MHAPTERGDPFPHSRKTHVPLELEPFGRHAGWQPPAVIAYLQEHSGVTDRDADVDRAGLGMPQHIGERLLQRSKQGQLGLPRKWRKGCRRGESDLDPASLAEIGHQRPQRREQPEVVEERRSQVIGDAPNASDSRIDQPQDLIQAVRALGLHLITQQAKLHFDDEKTWAVSSWSSRESRRRSSSCCSTIRADRRASSTVRPPGGCTSRHLQRGPDLVPEGEQKFVVQRGERVPRITDQDQCRNDYLRRKIGKMAA